MLLYSLLSIALCGHLVTTEDSFTNLIDAIHDESVTVEENLNNDRMSNLNIPVEVITDVPVEFATTFTKIGDIEIDAEVHEVMPKEGQSSVPEIAVVPELGDTVLPEANFGPSYDDGDHNADDRRVIDHFKYEDFDNGRNWRPYQETGDNSTTESQNNQSTPPPETPTSPEAPKSSFTIWPIILVAILFLLFIMIGLCWAIITFCKTKRQEDEEDRQTGSATSSGKETSDTSDASIPPSPSPDTSPSIPEGSDVSPSPAEESKPSLRTADSDKSIDAAKSPSAPSTSPIESPKK